MAKLVYHRHTINEAMPAVDIFPAPLQTGLLRAAYGIEAFTKGQSFAVGFARHLISRSTSAAIMD